MAEDRDLGRIVGRTIQKILTGPVRESKGVELSGIAGPVWHYADLLVVLDDGHILSISPGESVVLDHPPPGSSPCRLFDDVGEECIGKRVIDLLADACGEPYVYLLLEGSSYLEHCYLPGGSRHFFCNLLRELTPEERDEEVVSLISGQVQSWTLTIAQRNSALPPQHPGTHLA